MRCGYPSAKRPRMPDRTSLRAPRANESFVHLFKGGGVQGQSPCPRSAERGILWCLFERRRGSKGEPSPGVPPFFLLGLYVCADTLGGGRWLVLRFDPISLVLAQRNGVEPPKKSAFLPRCLHHSRERYKSVDYTFLARLGGGGWYVCAVFLGVGRYPLLPVPPHFFALAQRNGVEPQRNALLGAATGGVGSRPPLPRTRSPNITADCVKLT